MQINAFTTQRHTYRPSLLWDKNINNPSAPRAIQLIHRSERINRVPFPTNMDVHAKLQRTTCPSYPGRSITSHVLMACRGRHTHYFLKCLCIFTGLGLYISRNWFRLETRRRALRKRLYRRCGLRGFVVYRKKVFARKSFFCTEPKLNLPELLNHWKIALDFR